ncbi:MAG: hypothetical protein AAFX03_02375 [Pseudomonadota bacterium]
MAPTLFIPRRFNGPPDSGNGGYCAGLAAGFVDGQAEITLRAPVPLDTGLDVEITPEGADVRHGDVLVMEARARAPLETPSQTPPSADDAAAAAENYRSVEEHALPACFVCGPARAEGDGLRIFTTRLDGTDQVAAPWTPTDNLAADDGAVAEEFVWAALDCAGAFALDVEPLLLGRFAAKVLDRPSPGETTIVIGWPIGSSGRKHHAGTALYSGDGRLLAHAEATWIKLTRPHGAA